MHPIYTANTHIFQHTRTNIFFLLPTCLKMLMRLHCFLCICFSTDVLAQTFGKFPDRVIAQPPAIVREGEIHNRIHTTTERDERQSHCKYTHATLCNYLFTCETNSRAVASIVGVNLSRFFPHICALIHAVQLTT